VRNTPFYVAMRVTTNGEREILGMYAGDGGEDAGLWLQVFSELKNRGVEDVLIAACDGLKGLPEAITTACERTVMQQYIVFRIRNSFRYAGRQHRDGVVNIHSTRLHGPARASDEGPVRRVHGRMGQRYRAMVRLCESSWAGFVPVLEYDAEIRGALHDDRARVDQRNDTEGGEGIRALSERNRGPGMPVPGYQDLLIQLAAVGHAG
jgi:transposase-like protein